MFFRFSLYFGRADTFFSIGTTLGPGGQLGSDVERNTIDCSVLLRP
jgi:hypothetical protein